MRRGGRRCVVELPAGKHAAASVRDRLRIGMIHKLAGMEPKLYLAAIRRLKAIVRRAPSRPPPSR